MNTLEHRPLLYLEDCDEDFEMMRTVAQALGLPNPLHRATTGEECLELLRSGPVRPAVALLDLSVPGLDGRELLQEIKADPVLREVPVVILSSSSDPRDLAWCYGAGASAYHIKPVQYPDHMQLLRAILEYWLSNVGMPGSGKAP
jgi:CheY-like chemotaxis protein